MMTFVKSKHVFKINKYCLFIKMFNIIYTFIITKTTYENKDPGSFSAWIKVYILLATLCLKVWKLYLDKKINQPK